MFCLVCMSLPAVPPPFSSVQSSGLALGSPRYCIVVIYLPKVVTKERRQKAERSKLQVLGKRNAITAVLVPGKGAKYLDNDNWPVF